MKKDIGDNSPNQKKERGRGKRTGSAVKNHVQEKKKKRGPKGENRKP